jgi:hypothetical protein
LFIPHIRIELVSFAAIVPFCFLCRCISGRFSVWILTWRLKSAALNNNAEGHAARPVYRDGRGIEEYKRVDTSRCCTIATRMDDGTEHELAQLPKSGSEVCGPW